MSDSRVTIGGLYRHYKGGRYVLLFVATTHAHNGDEDAVYVSLTHGHTVTRPYQRDSRKEDSWTDFVRWPDGQIRLRFVLESNLSLETLLACFPRGAPNE
jgi:hypothetical protein